MVDDKSRFAAEVHIWAADVPPLAISASALSDVDMAHLQRLRSAEDRRRFAAGRWLLKRSLSHFTGTPMDQWSLVRGQNGRLEATKAGFPTMKRKVSDISLAHAGEAVVAAITSRGRVGIDIEPADAISSADDIDVAFTAEERAWLCRIPEPRRALSAVYLWTRKEAYAKALGLGVALEFGDVDVRRPYLAHTGVKEAGLSLASRAASFSGENYVVTIASSPGGTVIWHNVSDPSGGFFTHNLLDSSTDLSQ